MTEQTNNRTRSSFRFGLRAFLLLILVISLAVFASRAVSYHQFKREQERLLKEKEKYEEQIARAEYHTDGAINYEDIVRIAREKFHLAFPDDTLIYSGQGSQS